VHHVTAFIFSILINFVGEVKKENPMCQHGEMIEL
jgi:hypothetical protein